jgi:hypothetical protein
MPCPECGSTRRTVAVSLGGSITPRGFLRGRAFRCGARKWFAQIEKGSSFFLKTGRWHRLERLIDRARNRYREHIIDSETGRVVRHVEEPLTDHTGRGSAKHQGNMHVDCDG